MLPDPLHPAIVHFPIVLATFFPLVAGIGLYVGFRNPANKMAWRVVLVYAALTALSSRIAISTGEDQEDTVEDVVGDDAIHEHEEHAETFSVTAIVTLLVAAAGLASGKAGMAGRTLAVAGSIVLPLQVITVGKTGGELVYVHGAASAYVESTGNPAGGVERRAEDHQDDDDDDDD